MNPAFCVAALEEATKRYGEPAIFNTDHAGRSLCELRAYASRGSQFASDAFTGVLKRRTIEIGLKYEDIYLKSYKAMT